MLQVLQPECTSIAETFTDLGEIFLVDGGETGVQESVTRGQRLDEGQKLWAGLYLPQDGHTHGEETLGILSTLQYFP